MHRLALALVLPWALQAQEAPRIELRVGQDGVVGTTGTLYRIAPEGTWTVSNFFNARLDPPHAKGALSPQQMATLEALLPEGPGGTLAEGPVVNAFRLELTVDGRAYEVEMARGTEATACAGGAEPACAVTGDCGNQRAKGEKGAKRKCRLHAAAPRRQKTDSDNRACK